VPLEITGADRVKAALAALGPKARVTLDAALYQEGERIMADSKATYVPVDTGTLRASGRVDPPMQEGGVTVVTLGYGGPSAQYALAVHENPRAGHTGGFSPSGRPYAHYAKVGEWKYLETPWKAAAAGLVERLASELERVVHAGG
jgi:hypothetical protein